MTIRSKTAIARRSAAEQKLLESVAEGRREGLSYAGLARIKECSVSKITRAVRAAGAGQRERQPVACPRQARGARASDALWPGVSRFGGTATIVPASGLRFNVSGRWASEHDVVSLPVGLRFNVSRR